METRVCKECGKIFVPKSKRQQYCEDIHYRPCPICGKPVEAKYLSDPARCCSNECKQEAAKRKKQGNKKVTMTTRQSFTRQPVANTTSPTSNAFQQMLLNQGNVTTTATIQNRATASTVQYTGELSTDMKEYADSLRASSDIRTYVGTDGLLGFHTGHEYTLDISKDINSPYAISASFDLSTMQNVDLLIYLSSTISINQHFIYHGMGA